MRKSWVVGLGLLAVFMGFGAMVQAEEVAVPAAINYQGMLTNPSDGSPVDQGVYHLEFRVWSDPTDTDQDNLIWGRVFAVHVMSNGVFNILLTDDGSPVTSPVPQTNDLKQAFQGENRYLGLTITHGPNGTINSPEISPRQRMVSSPFSFHAQNATDAFHAEHADEAVLAQDSEKLGGTLAKEYYDNDRFDALGLNGAYNTLVGWEAGGIASRLGIYEYGGRYCIGGIAENPGEGVKLLIKDEKLKVREGMIAEGPITPNAGSNEGIRFPDNIGTGTGDAAGLSYFVAENTEDCELRLYVNNDSEDKIRIESSGNIEINAGNELVMRGKVNAFGGIRFVRNMLDDGGDYENHPDRDGFFYINSDNVAYTVYLGSYSWYLRTVDDDDHNINMQSYPVAKGELFKVHLNDNWPDTSHLKIYWCPFGL